MVTTLLRLVGIDLGRLARDTAITVVLAMLGACAAMLALAAVNRAADVVRKWLAPADRRHDCGGRVHRMADRESILERFR